MTLANERQESLMTSLAAARDSACQRERETQQQLAAVTDKLATMAANYNTLAPLIGRCMSAGTALFAPFSKIKFTVVLRNVK